MQNDLARWAPVQHTTEPERERLFAVTDRDAFAKQFHQVGVAAIVSQDRGGHPGTPPKQEH